MVERHAALLNAENLQSALVIASLPDNIRGYEEIKMKNVHKTKKEAEEKLSSYLSPEPNPQATTQTDFATPQIRKRITV